MTVDVPNHILHVNLHLLFRNAFSLENKETILCGWSSFWCFHLFFDLLTVQCYHGFKRGSNTMMNGKMPIKFWHQTIDYKQYNHIAQISYVIFFVSILGWLLKMCMPLSFSNSFFEDRTIYWILKTMEVW